MGKLKGNIFMGLFILALMDYAKDEEFRERKRERLTRKRFFKFQQRRDEAELAFYEKFIFPIATSDESEAKKLMKDIDKLLKTWRFGRYYEP